MHQLFNNQIPNPLFDLAGITCGKFLIPFWTFFSATAIGKSVIKVHIQVIFVIVVFSKNHVDHLIEGIEGLMPSLKGKISSYLAKQKKNLFHKTVEEVGY